MKKKSIKKSVFWLGLQIVFISSTFAMRDGEKSNPNAQIGLQKSSAVLNRVLDAQENLSELKSSVKSFQDLLENMKKQHADLIRLTTESRSLLNIALQEDHEDVYLKRALEIAQETQLPSSTFLEPLEEKSKAMNVALEKQITSLTDYINLAQDILSIQEAQNQAPAHQPLNLEFSFSTAHRPGHLENSLILNPENNRRSIIQSPFTAIGKSGIAKALKNRQPLHKIPEDLRTFFEIDHNNLAEAFSFYSDSQNSTEKDFLEFHGRIEALKKTINFRKLKGVIFEQTKLEHLLLDKKPEALSFAEIASLFISFSEDPALSNANILYQITTELKQMKDFFHSITELFVTSREEEKKRARRPVILQSLNMRALANHGESIMRIEARGENGAQSGFGTHPYFQKAADLEERHPIENLLPTVKKTLLDIFKKKIDFGNLIAWSDYKQSTINAETLSLEDLQPLFYIFRSTEELVNPETERDLMHLSELLSAISTVDRHRPRSHEACSHDLNRFYNALIVLPQTEASQAELLKEIEKNKANSRMTPFLSFLVRSLVEDPVTTQQFEALYLQRFPSSAQQMSFDQLVKTACLGSKEILGNAQRKSDADNMLLNLYNLSKTRKPLREKYEAYEKKYWALTFLKSCADADIPSQHAALKQTYEVCAAELNWSSDKSQDAIRFTNAVKNFFESSKMEDKVEGLAIANAFLKYTEIVQKADSRMMSNPSDLSTQICDSFISFINTQKDLQEQSNSISKEQLISIGEESFVDALVHSARSNNRLDANPESSYTKIFKAHRPSCQVSFHTAIGAGVFARLAQLSSSTQFLEHFKNNTFCNDIQ
jgi:hypothetical protein